jgi:guanine nucleotide-binding protein alpha-1 subunit
MVPVSSSMSRSISLGGPSKLAIPSTSRSLPPAPVSPTSNVEPSVPTSLNWKKAFRFEKIQNPKNSHGGELKGWWEDPNDPVHVLSQFAPHISELWKDPKVRHRLAERRVRLEESSGL